MNRNLYWFSWFAFLVSAGAIIAGGFILLKWQQGHGFYIAFAGFMGLAVLGFLMAREGEVLDKTAQRWAEDNIVRPVSWRVNAVTIACSNATIPEIKKRLKEIKEAVEADPEFWEYYLPGLIKKEEK